MTRINLIPVEDLTKEHLLGEKHEITRVFRLAKNSKKPKIPPEYRMGKGHVSFFYDKLIFVANRYEQICDEMRKRGYVCNQIPRELLLENAPSKYLNDYIPDKTAIAISVLRINERLGIDN